MSASLKYHALLIIGGLSALNKWVDRQCGNRDIITIQCYNPLFVSSGLIVYAQRFDTQFYSRLYCFHSFLSPASADEETDQEMETWAYHKEWDKLNNLSFSLARSPMPKRGLYDDIRLEIICEDNNLQLVAETQLNHLPE